MRVLAHRGFSAAYPENTLEAFTQALAAGADGVEMDVTCSADGVPVVIHDDTLDRTTDGHGPVTSQPLEVIETLDAGSWFDPRFAGEGVPTLAAALDAVARGGEVNVELKGGRGRAPDLVARVLPVLEAHSAPERTIVSSFDPRLLRELRQADHRWPIALLFSSRGWLAASWRLWARALAVDFLHPQLEALPRVWRAHEPPARVNVWTVNEAAEIRRLAVAGLRGVITDRPDRARAALSEGGPGDEM